MNHAPPVYLPKTIQFTEEQFAEIIKANPNLRFELTASGELIAMPPTGGETGRYNAALTADISLWNRQTQLGEVFDSSTGFRLPNGAIRSPDVAWITKERWQRLTPEERQGFVPLCPDFVIELASASDDLFHLRAKMQEYIDNGCRLGWLIVPQQQIAEIYRPQRSPESVSLPATLSGEEILPHFCLAFSP